MRRGERGREEGVSLRGVEDQSAPDRRAAQAQRVAQVQTLTRRVVRAPTVTTGRKLRLKKVCEMGIMGTPIPTIKACQDRLGNIAYGSV